MGRLDVNVGIVDPPVTGDNALAIIPVSEVTHHSSDAKKSLRHRIMADFVGLNNQGATCYLNSLLQSLFMTPEFRSILYAWKHPDDDKNSIRYQLQKLFAFLHMSDRPSVDTTSLTQSFGWTSSDAFTQHDVQELLRVLLDALEPGCKDSPQDSVIADLYTGKISDYVRCKQCQNESRRIDTYQDVPLVLRPFGASTTNRPPVTVKGALRQFTTPEELTESNQWNCSVCDKKVDAYKGLSFLSFPPLLTLQLKRFDFDYQTMQRIKINDRVTFPHVLSVADLLPRNEDVSLKDVDLNASINNIKLDDNKYEYELFSVMIHSGSAMGGHYYAYIKDLDTKKWYNFNDSYVTELDESEIENAFGISPSSATSSVSSRTSAGWTSFQSNASAYLLMYRRISERKSLPCKSLIPEELKKIVEADNLQLLQQKQAQEEERKVFSITVTLSDASKYAVSVLRTATVEHLRLVCFEKSTLKNLNYFDCRLRVYKEGIGLPAQVLPNEKTLKELNIYDRYSVILETRAPGAAWPREWSDDEVPLKIVRSVIKDDTITYLEPNIVVVDKDITLGAFVSIIRRQLVLTKPFIKVIKLPSYKGHGLGGEILVGDEKIMRRAFHIYEGTVLHVEECDQENLASVILLNYERTRNLFTLHVNVIRSDKESTSESLSIEIDRRKSLGDLKQMLHTKINIPLNSMRIRSVKTSAPFRLDTAVLSILVVDGGTIIVDEVFNSGLGNITIHFSLINSLVSLFEATPLTSLLLSEDMTIDQVKCKLFSHLSTVPSMDAISKVLAVTPTEIRLRQVLHHRPGKIGRSHEFLKSIIPTFVAESSTIFVEVVQSVAQQRNNNEINSSSQQSILLLQRWRPLSNTLDDREEIAIDMSLTVKEFIEMLERRSGIPRQELFISKPSMYTQIAVCDISNLDWKLSTGLINMNNNIQTLDKSPYYMMEGDILLYRDGAVDISVSQDEKMKLGNKIIFEGSSKMKGKGSSNEKSLVIRKGKSGIGGLSSSVVNV